MREIKLKYLCKSFSNAIAAKELNSEATNGYPVYGAAGLMGYKDSYDTDVEYLGIVKDGAGVGRINVYPAKSSLLGTMATIIPNDNVDIKWLQYAISNLNLGESVDKATIPHIYFSVYGNSYIRDISISDQQKIAAHLDRKCTQIDALISNAQQQIEKLKAYKQSVITETVTKGLEPYVTMKDSGIEWIGEIPEHWKIGEIKRFASTCSGGTPNSSDSSFYDGDINWICSYDLKENEIFESLRKITQKGADSISGELQTSGSVLIAMYGGSGTIGNSGLLRCDAKTNQAICSIHFKEKFFIPKYAFYETIFMRKNWMIFAVGTRKDPNINQEIVKNMVYIGPPLSEQQAITDYLDHKCSQIDKLIALKQQKIEKLQQYKKSLIYEYVTGKKEVS